MELPKPLRLRPQRWTPPRDPGMDAGPFARNERLAAARVVPVPGEGPEDTSFGPDGTVYTGVESGDVLALPGGDPDGTWQVVGNTGGRPGGIEVVDDGGALVIADYARGLLRMQVADGRVEVLTDDVDGQRLRCFNNAAVHPDGRIFFTTSSDRWDVHDLRLDAIEHRPTGRLLEHDPSTGRTRVLLEQLPMANGTTVAADGSFVAVATTAGYDVRRYWLTGPRADSHDRLVDSLPGMPDNLATGADGRIWIAMVVPRNPILEFLLPFPTTLPRRLLGAVPEQVIPDGPRCMIAVAVDPDSGEVVDNLQAWDDPPFHYVTGANEDAAGRLWLSSIKEHALAVHDPAAHDPAAG